MPFNGSGGTSQPAGSIYPATANTLIESAKANASIADIYTMLASCIVKDGQTTTTQRIPFAAGASMGSQTITAVADGTAVTHAATVGQVRSGAPVLLGSVAGTNTITAALTPALTAYAAGNKFILTPANTNTGATTVNVDSVGAKSIFWNGAACVGGELRQNIPALIEYDGTQFHIVGNGFNAPFLDTHAVVEGSADSTKKLRFEVDGLTTATTRVLTPLDADYTLGDRVNLGTEQASTSGTSIDFTGIPAGTRRITINFVGVSTSGTSAMIVQIGDAGGPEDTGYLGAVSSVAGTVSTANKTTGFGAATNSAGTVLHGSIVLSLEDSAQFTWTSHGILGQSDAAQTHLSAGSKSLSAELTQVRITTEGGADTFDAGAINIQYER